MALARRHPVPRATAAMRGAEKRSSPSRWKRKSVGCPGRCPPLSSTAPAPSPSSAAASRGSSSFAPRRASASATLGVRTAPWASRRYARWASEEDPSNSIAPLDAARTGSTTSGNRGRACSSAAISTATARLPTMPILIARTSSSSSSASIDSATRAGLTASNPRAARVVWTVRAVATQSGLAPIARTGPASGTSRPPAAPRLRADRDPPAPARTGSSSPRSVHQGLVEGVMLGTREQLGMPLDAQRKCPRQLDGLHDLVGSDRADPRPPSVLDGLMMRRVHLDLDRADNAGEIRPGKHLGGVARLARVALLLVVERARHLVADVLVESTAQLDRQKLHAAADPEHRYAGGQGCAKDAPLVRGASGLARPRAAARLRSVDLG